MATTSLKLPDALKQRVNVLAAQVNKSPHAFMIDLIAAETERIEEDRAFMAHAEASLKHHQKTDVGYDANEVHAYLRAKIRGVTKPEPKPVKRN